MRPPSSACTDLSRFKIRGFTIHPIGAPFTASILRLGTYRRSFSFLTARFKIGFFWLPAIFHVALSDCILLLSSCGGGFLSLLLLSAPGQGRPYFVNCTFYYYTPCIWLSEGSKRRSHCNLLAVPFAGTLHVPMVFGLHLQSLIMFEGIDSSSSLLYTSLPQQRRLWWAYTIVTARL